MEYIYSVIEKYNWDQLNDEQKFNVALLTTFDYLATVIKTSNPTTHHTFKESVNEIDFCSCWVNIYFEYTFWLAIDFLNEKGHWFTESLLTSFQEIGLKYVQYQFNKQEVAYHSDHVRETKQCEILYRLKAIK